MGATFTFVELSIAGRNPRIESIESSFEFRVAALEAETFAEPQSDRIAVLPEEFCDITSSEAIADQGKGDELDSSSDLIRLPISRCEIVETVRGGGLESGRELRELELEPLFGEPAPVEQSCSRVTTEIGNLVDISGRPPPGELVDARSRPLCFGNRPDPFEVFVCRACTGRGFKSDKR